MVLPERIYRAARDGDRDTVIAYLNAPAEAGGLPDVTKSLLRKMMPVARRLHGDNDRLTLKMRWSYAQSLYYDSGATLNDLREAVTTLEDLERITRRVFGGAHPLTASIGDELRDARAVLRAREASRA